MHDGAKCNKSLGFSEERVREVHQDLDPGNARQWTHCIAAGQADI
jgi:hypothetical protein